MAQTVVLWPSVTAWRQGPAFRLLSLWFNVCSPQHIWTHNPGDTGELVLLFSVDK